MKKIIALLVGLSVISCSTDNNQIKAVKNKLATYVNISPAEINNYKFEVFEISDKDAYFKLSNLYQDKASKEINEGDALNQASGYLKKSSDFLEKQKTSTGKKFHVVYTYKVVVKDTLIKEYYYLNEKDSIFHKHGK